MCTARKPCTRQEMLRKQESRWSKVVCLCATLSQALVMGIAQGSFGVFLPVIMEEFDSSRGETAWIGSVALGLSFFAAPLAGHLSERFGCRAVTIFGGLTCAVSLVITSLARTINQVFFTYTLLFGLGASCVRTSTFLVAAKYFHRRRSLATGVVSAGPVIGMFVYGPLTQQLLTSIGLQNTYRALSGFSLLVCLLAGSFSPNADEEEYEHNCQMQTSKEDDDSNENKSSFSWRTVLNCSVWKTPAFTIITIAYAVTALGDFVPLIHLVKHCKELGIPGDSASRLLMFFGLASFTGRILIGRLGDCKCVNLSLYVIHIGMLAIAISILLLPLARSYRAFVVFSIVDGFCDGAIGSQLNLLLLTTVSPKLRATAFGYANCLVSLSLMTGPSVAGLIADSLGSYVPAFYVAGSEVLLGACITAILFCLKSPSQQTVDRTEMASLTTTYRRNSGEMDVEVKRTVHLVVELYQGDSAEKILTLPSDHHSGNNTSEEDRGTDV